MGHLSIVNEDTLSEVLSTGYVSTRGVLKRQAIKTLSDIFSDAVAARRGDLVFPWIVAGEHTANIGFRYVFKIDGPPIYVCGEEYPIKLPIHNEIIKYETPLPESNALDLFRDKLLWNAIGKKSLGRGRSLTHQTPNEDKLLIKLLKEINVNPPVQIRIERRSYPESEPITIATNQCGSLENFMETLEPYNEWERISHLDLSQIPWCKYSLFSYEKTFEAWLMENFDTGNCSSLWTSLGVTNPVIDWFGNYLPFGVAGSNIDAVALLRSNNRISAFIFELKNVKTDYSSYRAISRQILEYSKFIRSALKSFSPNEHFEIIPVIITPYSEQFPNSYKLILDDLTINWLGYTISNFRINFFNHFDQA